MGTEYTIYCDESSSKGAYFSDFYGGALVRSEHIDEVKRILAETKASLNFGGEVKWSKVPGHKQYLQKYIDLMTCFFDLIKSGKVKIRIMFRQNMFQHKNLSQEIIERKYFVLYYTFLKSGFGLDCSPVVPGGVSLRIYPDQIPDKQEEVAKFRDFLLGLARRPEFRERQITIRPEDITDVASHDHDILQCLDVILGAMHFKLNDLDKEKEKGKKRRAKRTRAKQKLYKHINKRIRDIYPHFNIGVSTGFRTSDARWSDEYRHWRLMPRAKDRLVVHKSKHKQKKRAP